MQWFLTVLDLLLLQWNPMTKATRVTEVRTAGTQISKETEG